MTLSRVKPANWSTGEVLTSAQMNALDVQLPYAVDGNAGGTYAPSGQIVLDGAGLRVNGSFRAAGSSQIDSCTLTVAGIPTISPAATAIRIQKLTPVSSTNWTYTPATHSWDQSVVSNTIYFPLTELPDGSTLTTVTALVSGPSTAATARVEYQNVSGTVTNSATTNDSGGPGIRSLTVSSLSITISHTGVGTIIMPYLRIVGSSSAGFKVHGVWCQLTCAALNA